MFTEPLVPHIRSRRILPGIASIVVAWAVVGGSVVLACTVPVFRFALERWAADQFLVVVYYSSQLSAEQDSALTELAERSAGVGGPLNIEVIRYDVASPPARNLFDLGSPPADQPLPYVEVRRRLDWAHTALRWRGS